MNNAIEACNKYVERIKDLEGKVVSDQIQIDRLEALLKAGAIEHDKRMCDMGDITTRMQARIDALEARNAELEAIQVKTNAVCEKYTVTFQDCWDRLKAAEARAKRLEGALREILDIGGRTSVEVARQALAPEGGEP